MGGNLPESSPTLRVRVGAGPGKEEEGQSAQTCTGPRRDGHADRVPCVVDQPLRPLNAPIARSVSLRGDLAGRDVRSVFALAQRERQETSVANQSGDRVPL